MRIVYLAKARIPSRKAHSINVMKMCEAFAKNGHTVILMNYDYPNVEPGIKDIFGYYGVAPCFTVRLLPLWEAVLHKLRLASWVTRWHVRQQRPDIVFARNNSLDYGLAQLGVPVVLECHRPLDKSRNILHLQELLNSKRLLRMTTISNALYRAYVASFQIPEAIIRVSPSGADIPATASPVTRTESTKLQVGYVGSLYRGKGMEIIVEIARRCSWAEFHVVGDLQKGLRDWKVLTSDLPNVRFHGFVPHPEAVRYQLAMDVLLLPNQRNVYVGDKSTIDIGAWTSPMKLFEYMAAAKAIVASDLPVIREVLTHQLTAYLCPPDDPNAWVEALSWLRNHPAERARLGKNAAATFAENYTWQVRAQRVLNGIEPT